MAKIYTIHIFPHYFYACPWAHPFHTIYSKRRKVCLPSKCLAVSFCLNCCNAKRANKSTPADTIISHYNYTNGQMLTTQTIRDFSTGAPTILEEVSATGGKATSILSAALAPRPRNCATWWTPPLRRLTRRRRRHPLIWRGRLMWTRSTWMKLRPQYIKLTFAT